MHLGRCGARFNHVTSIRAHLINTRPHLHTSPRTARPGARRQAQWKVLMHSRQRAEFSRRFNYVHKCYTLFAPEIPRGTVEHWNCAPSNSGSYRIAVKHENPDSIVCTLRTHKEHLNHISRVRVTRMIIIAFVVGYMFERSVSWLCCVWPLRPAMTSKSSSYNLLKSSYFAICNITRPPDPQAARITSNMLHKHAQCTQKHWARLRKHRTRTHAYGNHGDYVASAPHESKWERRHWALWSARLAVRVLSASKSYSTFRLPSAHDGGTTSI